MFALNEIKMEGKSENTLQSASPQTREPSLLMKAFAPGAGGSGRGAFGETRSLRSHNPGVSIRFRHNGRNSVNAAFSGAQCDPALQYREGAPGPPPSVQPLKCLSTSANGFTGSTAH